jgi:hypothetical protein
MANNKQQRPSWFAKMASQMSSAQLNIAKSGQTMEQNKIYQDVCRNMKNILTDISNGNIERENLIFLINPMISMAMNSVAVDKYNRWLHYYNATLFVIESAKVNSLSIYSIQDINGLIIANQDAMNRSSGWKVVIEMLDAISRVAIMSQQEIINYNYQLPIVDLDPMTNILMNIVNTYRDAIKVNNLFD